jgi:hypothetical protein
VKRLAGGREPGLERSALNAAVDDTDLDTFAGRARVAQKSVSAQESANLR